MTSSRTPAGKGAVARTCFTRSVKASVSTPGALNTARSTPATKGAPDRLTRVWSRANSRAKVTSATAPSRKVIPSRRTTGSSRKSSRVENRPDRLRLARISSFSNTPSGRSTPAATMALRSSTNVSPLPLNRAGSTAIRTMRSRAPDTSTLRTPGMRSMVSCKARALAAKTASSTSPCNISPIAGTSLVEICSMAGASASAGSIAATSPTRTCRSRIASSTGASASNSTRITDMPVRDPLM